jgi:hypothetical protein
LRVTRVALGIKIARERKEQLVSSERLKDGAYAVGEPDSGAGDGRNQFPPRKRLMLTFASQTFANGIWTITPEEPATLPLLLVGLGTLAVYAAFAGWRPRRATAEARIRHEQPSEPIVTRRAA